MVYSLGVDLEDAKLGYDQVRFEDKIIHIGELMTESTHMRWRAW